MTKRKTAKPPLDEMVREQDKVLTVEQSADETPGAAYARTYLEPNVRHGLVGISFAAGLTGGNANLPAPALMDCARYVKGVGDRAAAGDIETISRMLSAQALTLDAMFTEYARRACSNMGQYMSAAESYTRLALKAQSNSRATLQALADLHRPREQTVKHIHVNQGGQAVVADQFHQHQAGGQSANSAEQSQTAGNISQFSALPS